jgi:hypothetical protein
MVPFKKSSLLIHLAGWIIFLCLPLLFLSSHPQARGYSDLLSGKGFWIFCLSFILLFYLNTYVLVPRLYLSRRYTVYFPAVVLLLIVFNFLRPFERVIRENNLHRPGIENFRPLPPPPPPHFRRPPGPGIDITTIFLFSVIIVLGISIQTREKLTETENRMAKAEADKANAELSFLKAQINPHFLFNTLNNIYGMAVTGHDGTAESILKLSNIMRYVTDEAVRDFVPLQLEAECIRDYVDLQKLRTGTSAGINFTITGDLVNHSVPPLLLMTFVENIFKYGITKRESLVIDVIITAEETYFSFFTRNRIYSDAERSGRSGIGIENAKKRLNHLYPGKHNLSIEKKDGYFSVELKVFK